MDELAFAFFVIYFLDNEHVDFVDDFLWQNFGRFLDMIKEKPGTLVGLVFLVPGGVEKE